MKDNNTDNRIRILYTSDIHGTVFPYSYADGRKRLAGLARVKTLMDALRDENTVVIDNGDLIEGSPLMTWHYRSYRESVCPATRAMRMIGYDFMNLGNHDFNFGWEALQLHIEESGAACLTSNLLYEGKALWPSYSIREIAGKRVAFIAVTTQCIPQWEKAEHIKGMTFLDAFATLKEAVERLKAEQAADYIVGIYHGGIEADLTTGEAAEPLTGENEGYRMMKEIAGLDILLTGHQHRVYCEKVSDTVLLQPGVDGAYIGQLDIDTVTGEMTPSLVKTDAAPDEEMMRLLQAEEDACQKWLDAVVGRTKIDLRISDEFDARLNKSQVVTFLNLVQREATGAQLSAASVFLDATGFEEEITMRQLVATYPFPNTLCVKELDGAALRAYLEKTAEFWTIKDGAIAVSATHDFPTPQHYNYDMVDGIDYTITVSKPFGARITKLTYEGRDVKDTDVFTLAVNNYRASGGGNYAMIRDARTLKESQTDMVELLSDYLAAHPVIDFVPVHNIRVTM